MRSWLRSGLFLCFFFVGLCVSARVRNSDSLLYIFYFQIWAHSSLAHTCLWKVAIYMCGRYNFHAMSNGLISIYIYMLKIIFDYYNFCMYCCWWLNINVISHKCRPDPFRNAALYGTHFGSWVHNVTVSCCYVQSN